MAELTTRRRAIIGVAVVAFLGALIAAAALAQSTRNQSDPTPTNGALFAATTPTPLVSVSPSPSVSPAPVIPVVTVTVTATRTTQVTVTSRAQASNHSGTPSRVNAGTGGQASVGGLSPGAAALGMAGVCGLTVGTALMAGRRTGARL